MKLPAARVHLQGAICPACSADWPHVHGTVFAIVDEDGAELYRRCACGHGWHGVIHTQPTLFNIEASA